MNYENVHNINVKKQNAQNPNPFFLFQKKQKTDKNEKNRPEELQNGG